MKHLEIRTKIEADIIINMLGLQFDHIAAFYETAETPAASNDVDWRTVLVPPEIDVALDAATEEEE